jgi:hypothetical protein
MGSFITVRTDSDNEENAEDMVVVPSGAPLTVLV